MVKLSHKSETLEEQGLQGIEKMRQLLVAHKTATSNQLRGLLNKFGVVIAESDAALRSAIPEVLEDSENEVSMSFRESIADMCALFQTIEAGLAQLTRQYTALTMQG